MDLGRYGPRALGPHRPIKAHAVPLERVMGDTFEDILARIAVSRHLIAAYAGMTAAILMSASEREEISSMLRGDR